MEDTWTLIFKIGCSFLPGHISSKTMKQHCKDLWGLPVQLYLAFLLQLPSVLEGVGRAESGHQKQRSKFLSESYWANIHPASSLTWNLINSQSLFQSTKALVQVELLFLTGWHQSSVFASDNVNLLLANLWFYLPLPSTFLFFLPQASLPIRVLGIPKTFGHLGLWWDLNVSIQDAWATLSFAIFFFSANLSNWLLWRRDISKPWGEEAGWMFAQ